MDEHFDIIIAGAGIAGASCAFWLSMRRRVLLLEADRRPGGASQVAAGIVNPFAGPRGRPMWRGLRALESLDALVSGADAANWYRRCGALRPAASAEQAASFREVAETYPRYASWHAHEDALERFPGMHTDCGVLRLHRGGIMDTPRLIGKLLLTAEQRGAVVRMDAKLQSWSSSPGGAFVVTADGACYRASRLLLCLGSQYTSFAALRALNLHRNKGQVVHVQRPPEYTLTMPVSGQGYVVPVQDALVVGTTYERDFDTDSPTAGATRQILRNASSMVPDLESASVLSAAAGIRVGVPGTRLPMLGPISEHVWVFTGLGSKGLLLSALISRKLSTYLGDAARIPPKLRVTYSNSM